MNSTRTVAVRLDNQVAQEYERLAQLKGDKLGTYLRDLLTSNLQMASIERQVSRIETLVNDFEKQINYSLDKFTEANEPYRVCRRVNILRDYPDDKIKIYP